MHRLRFAAVAAAFLAFLLVPLARPAVAIAPAGTTVPMHIENGHVFVDVRLNGRGPYVFAFDTGAGWSVSRDVAAQLHLRTGKRYRIYGTGETLEYGATAVVNTFDVGGAHLASQRFMVASFDSLRAAEGVPRFDGLMGREFLERYVTTIDYAAQTLTFAPPASYHPSPAAVVVPLRVGGGMPEMSAYADGFSGLFGIDTGDRGSLTFMRPFITKNGLRERYHTSPQTIVGWGFGGPVRGELTRVHRFAFGTFEVDDVVTRFPTGTKGVFNTSHLAGNVGYGILSRFTVTFNYPKKQLQLVPSTAYADADRYDRSGMWLLARNGSLDVADVVPGSAAANAEIVAGDRLLAVDGKPVSDISLPELRRSFSSAATTNVTLTVEHGAESRTVTLALSDLV